MNLLLRPFLLLAALGRAAWLRRRGEEGPALGEAESWGGRFRLAVWLALATLPGLAQGAIPPGVTCYRVSSAPEPSLNPMARVRVLWMALDPAQGPALEAALASAARSGAVEIRLSNLLLRLHGILAFHRKATRPVQVTCYEMTPAGAKQMQHREAALAQLEALAAVRAKGTVAPEVLAQAEGVLRGELTRLGIEPAPSEAEAVQAAKVLTGWYAE